MYPVKNPNEAKYPRELSFTPPHKPIIQKRIPVNPAVLKLGCFIINKINNPNIKKKVSLVRKSNIILFFLYQENGKIDEKTERDLIEVIETIKRT